MKKNERTERVVIFWTTKKSLSDERRNYPNVISIPKFYKNHWNDTRPYQIWYGARFTAKSWTKAAQLLIKADEQEYFRCVFARNTQRAARKSQFQLFKDSLNRCPELKSRFSINESEMKIIHENGNYLQGGSFEDPESLMSVPDVTDFWAEEPISRSGSIDKEAFLDISGTLRNPHGIKPVFHFTFNPIGKSNFIFEDFFSDNSVYSDDVVCKVKPTPYDNPFCPEDRLEFLERLRKFNIKRYNVDGLGNWGDIKKGNEFYQAFNEAYHVKECKYDPTAALHYGMDYNFNPYMPSSVWQIERANDITYEGVYFERAIILRCIKEYALVSPLNSIEMSCKTFINDFKGHKSATYLYDDATGKANSPLNKDPDIRSFRARFKKEMAGFTQNYRFRNSNPPILDRRSLLNDIFSFGHQIIIEIDPSCKNTIKDFSELKTDHDGKKMKEKFTAKETREGKGSGEKYGHFSDIADYVTFQVNEYENQLKGSLNWKVTTH